ncbi:MAG: alpha/beta hydrolase, partial [Caulobacter sp.]|nr:alpha/beta hydrolase [Vitreoscilla sp.]
MPSFTAAAFASHRAPWWLPGGHLQTIWPSLFSRATVGDEPPFRRERWTSPDDDFIDVDFLAGPIGVQAETATRPL